MSSFFVKAWSYAKLRVLFVAIALSCAFLALISFKLCSNHADKSAGILLLQKAYRNHRSVESRIADFEYVPFITTRGPQESAPESLILDRAERVIYDDVYSNPGAESHRALGVFYLLNKSFDKAIREFEEALNYDPSDAKSHSDLGAALLEKGNTELEKERLQSQFTGQPIELLSQSFEHIHKALDWMPPSK